MLKDITLGQYFPGKSAIHRLDPRTKLVMLVAYIVALFMAVSWCSYGIMFLFLAVSIGLSGVPLKSFVKGLKPLLFILVFTAVLNIFFTEGETVPLFGQGHCQFVQYIAPGIWDCGIAAGCHPAD